MRRTTRLLILVSTLTACSLPADTVLSPVPGTAPGDETVERVILLMGDGGESPPEGTPLFSRLREEVEAWSAALASDSAVTVVFLGDNVYPNGVHSVGHPERARDSLRLANQIDIVAGPEAVRHRSLGLFLAGNHDWGGSTGSEGQLLLRNQEELIKGAAAAGVWVDLLPPALDPGPEVVDLGSVVKLVAVDSEWWLEDRITLRRTQALQQVTRAVQEPATRVVLFAAHHPLVSSGPHGGTVPFWPTLGVERVLSLTGSKAQDIASVPYQKMIEDFRAAFASSNATLLYAGGHEHGLQVIRGTHPSDPEWHFISGTGSQSSPMGDIDGLRFRSSKAGYMRMLVRTDGSVVVEVVAETEQGFETVFVQPIRRLSGTN